VLHLAGTLAYLDWASLQDPMKAYAGNRGEMNLDAPATPEALLAHVRNLDFVTGELEGGQTSRSPPLPSAPDGS
jgi:hypothetical protein